MNNIRFISSFTVGTIYEKIIETVLIPSLEQFALPYHIFAKPDLGRWDINSRQRPLYIKEAMELFPDENLVWIDADAKVLKYPELLFHIPEYCYIGVHYMQWGDHYTSSKYEIKETVEILDGTSYYKNSQKMKTFCDEWIERSVHAEKNHRLMLGQMIDERIHEDLNIFLLPREYCYIVSQPNGNAPAKPLANPVIAHFQASRSARSNLYKK